MFSRLNNGKYPCLTPYVNSNLSVEHCLQANYQVEETICHILREQANGVEVSYHVASVKPMEVHLWRGISAQHALYLLGGLELKISDKSVSLCFGERKAMTQGWMMKQHEWRARHEEHIIDLTVNGANFTSSISCHQQLLIAGTTIQTHGMRKQVHSSDDSGSNTR
jgi:hypothetical protein